MFTELVSEFDGESLSHRGWTTLLSFGFEALAVASVLALPLFFTQGLPSSLSPRLLVPIAEPRPSPRQAQAPSRNRWVSIVAFHPLMTPRSIPRAIAPVVNSEVEPPSLSPASSGDARSGASGSGILGSTGDWLPAVLPRPLPSTIHPPVSHMMQGNLIHRVEPTYPVMAKQARIQGSVVLRATIGKDGSIENLQLLSGHPMLAQAALDAVRQWRYRPYYLNGEAVEVETQVVVNFLLSGG
jgi:protein TonB